MPRPFDRMNDGTNNAPRLQVQHSLWSLEKLPMNAAPEAQWSMEEKFRRAREAGFEGMECWLNDENEAKTKAGLDAAGLRLTLGHSPHSLDDVRVEVARAARLGADFIFAHPLDPYVPIREAADFCREGSRMAADVGMCFLVETHRGNIPESLNQALQLIEVYPEVRLTGDLSHFVLIGEFYGWESEGALERMMPVLTRVAHLHGRVSDGESVQVDVGDGSGTTPQFFVRLWAAAMRAWLSDAKPGDVFPFASELGPPRYARTLLDGSEYSDRWEQSLVMKRLAEQAWQTAHSAA